VCVTERADARTACVEIRQLEAGDRAWVDRFILERWGAVTVVSRGQVHRPSELPGLLASENGEPSGLLTYSIDGEECEIVTIDSLVEGAGVGTALVDAVADAARAAGCRRLWLITTNDNLPALGFYQKRGFRLVAVHRNAVDEARELKPEIPLFGLDGIPIRDELELDLEL
jgi:ribosomal protein S18 acetylase RimI-like enzyme